MTALLFSLIAVFLIILIGFTAQATRLIDESAWRGFEAVTYHVLIPALVIHTLAYARLDGQPVLAIGGSLVFGVAAMTGIALASRRVLLARGLQGPAFTSLFQGAVRWNTFIALAVAAQNFGTEGVALMAVVIASLIPLVNVLSVVILSRYARNEPFRLMATLSTLARNPFIWSCAVGLALNPVAHFIPKPMEDAADIIGRAALAAGLLVVGAGVELKRLARVNFVHGLAIALKLIIMPLLVYGAGRALGLSGAPFAVALIAASVPTAAASYILARQMGGDAPLMAEIATLQTLLAMATMPFILLTLAV